MTNSARLAIAMLVSLGTWITSVTQAGDETGVDAKTAFARIKTLAGEWKVTGTDEHHGNPAIPDIDSGQLYRWGR